MGNEILKSPADHACQQALTALLFDSFSKNQLLWDVIFERDGRKLRRFLSVCTKYYSKCGTIFVKRNDAGKIVAAALWTESGQKPMDIGSVIRAGMLGDFLKAFWCFGPRTVKRLMGFTDTADKHHLHEPHNYLFMLASCEPGAGRELLHYCIKAYAGHTLFWESSVVKNDHAYYKSFGAVVIGKFNYLGTSNALFRYN